MADLLFFLQGTIEENRIRQALEGCPPDSDADGTRHSPSFYSAATILLRYYPSSDLSVVCVTIRSDYADHGSRLKAIEHIASFLEKTAVVLLEIERNGRDCVLIDKDGTYALAATTNDDRGDMHLVLDDPVPVSTAETIRYLVEDAAYLADLRSGKIRTGELDGD